MQLYLEALFKAILCLSYYGLLRVGEIADSPHVIKAKDIHIRINKEKILIILHSSKTHSRADPPQEIKITLRVHSNDRDRKKTKIFRHFKILHSCISCRRDYCTLMEQLFVYSDRTPVTIEAVCKMLKQLIARVNLDSKLFDTHSLRIGKANDMYKARHAHKHLYMVLPKYSKIQVLPGITNCRLMKDNKQAIELNDLLKK